MRSPQMIGEECARPGMGVCQRTLFPLLTSQVVGAWAVESTPAACTPRYCGHSLAAEAAWTNTQNETKARRRRGAAERDARIMAKVCTTSCVASTSANLADVSQRPVFAGGAVSPAAPKSRLNARTYERDSPLLCALCWL